MLRTQATQGFTVLLILLSIVSKSFGVTPPHITSVSQTSGVPLATTIIISGNDFNDTAANNVVYFGATKGAVIAATATQITVLVPKGALFADITVINKTTRLSASYSHPFAPVYDTGCFIPGTYRFKPRVDFALAPTTTGSPIPYASAIGDLDGDGLADLVVCTEGTVATSTGNISILHTYHNTSVNGVLSYAAAIVDTISVGGKNLKLADLDGDGRLDIIVSCSGSGRLSLLRNYSELGYIQLTQPVNYASTHTGAGTFQGPYESVVADFDGDGRLDIAVVNQNILGAAENEVEIFRNIRTTPITGNNAFPYGNMFTSYSVDFPVGAAPFSIVAADMDGDGKLDIATSSFFDNTITVMRNNSLIDTFIFDPPVNFPCGDGPLELQAADLNGDNKPDLCVVSFNDNKLTIFKNTAASGVLNASSFASGVSMLIASATGSSGLGIGDFDGDGKLDIAVSNNVSDNLSIFRNVTTGTAITPSSFVNEHTYATGGSPVGVSIGDVDGDTKPDIVVAANADNSISVFEHIQTPDTVSIRGIDSVCAGAAITLSNNHCNKSAGYWSATNNHASVSFTAGSATDSNAVIRGITAGIDTIVFATVYLSDTNYVRHIVRVLASADTGTISGTSAICELSSVTLTDAAPSGIWSSTNPGVASIDAATGFVTAQSAGATTILYTTNSLSCGPLSAHHAVTVNITPEAGTIAGAGGACIGVAITLTVVAPGVGGAWVNLYPLVATAAVSGFSNIVTGTVVGVDTILYVVPSAFCGSDTAMKILGFINSASSSFPITGASNICRGDSIMVSNSAGGGTWSTSTPAIVSINATSGVVTGLATGVASISYSVTYTCATVDTFTSFSVNPIPDVAVVTNQILCNTATSTPVIFTGGISGTVYTWNNNNSSIGLASSGTGNIATFVANNTTTTPVSAVVTVVPSASGCIGAAGTFSVVVNPTPVLTIPLILPAICSGTLLSYTATSATPGATFAWSRALTAGISNLANSSTGDPSEILVSTSSDSVIVTYIDTIKANSCINTQMLTVKVKPTPHLSSTLTPPAICDSTLFSYTPLSATAGAAFAWSRDTIAGVTNVASSDTGSISEVLINPTTDPVVVIYIDTLTANGCSGFDTIKVTVNPTPALSSILTAPAICDSTAFNYTPSSATLYTTFAWSRSAITGIANASDTGSGNPDEYLDNNSNIPVVVSYVYTLTSNNCSDSQHVTVTVNPQPVLSSTLTPNAICSNDTFNYTPASGVSGSVFNWTRAGVTGLGNAAATGADNPMEVLSDTVFIPVNVTYDYVITANGCSDTQAVVVQVKPVPVLSGILRDTVCSGSPFVYIPNSGVGATSYNWVRPAAAGIANPPSAGLGSINDTLTNLNYSQAHVVYIYTLTANGCSDTEHVRVEVDPKPSAAIITTQSPASLCANTLYQNFGTSSVLNDSVQYGWSAVNAAVWATGSSHRYCVVNFSTPGNAVVILSAGVAGFDCYSRDTFAVAVSSSVSDNPDVMYFHYQFVCTPGNEDTYQWGYDNTELDSTILKGEIYQDYINTAPDPDKYYWVMTSKNGCTQKTYYKTPTVIKDVTGQIPLIKVYPNPASDLLTIEFSNVNSPQTEVAIFNAIGQKVSTAKVINGTAVIDVSALPSGTYVVSGYSEGVKIGATRFIKN